MNKVIFSAEQVAQALFEYADRRRLFNETIPLGQVESVMTTHCKDGVLVFIELTVERKVEDPAPVDKP